MRTREQSVPRLPPIQVPRMNTRLMMDSRLTNPDQHRRIKHAEKVYVTGDVHTQTIVGLWSLVKREIGGVNESVGKRYLQTYLDNTPCGPTGAIRAILFLGR